MIYNKDLQNVEHIQLRSTKHRSYLIKLKIVDYSFKNLFYLFFLIYKKLDHIQFKSTKRNIQLTSKIR